MKQLCGFYILASVFLRHLCLTGGFDAATASGDIIIGGLFPIHESVSDTILMDGSDERICNRFNLASLVKSLVMAQAVEEINKSGKLGNLTLGYHIVDSCSDVTTALRNTLSFMKRNNINMNDAEQPAPPVVAVIGGYYSEISIAVTRQLNLENIPQVSYGSTCGQLSDKTRFPSFMRTVPEDDHQTRAVINILKSNKWSWVGLMATDSEAGRYAVERLQEHAKDNNICFAFISILPEALVAGSLQDSISDTVKSITDNRNVTVIVSFAKAYHMMYLFRGLLKDPRGRGKVWVASDNWSESANVLGNWTLSDVGVIIGITLKSGNTTRYKQYLQNLDVNPDHHKNNTFLYDYLKKKQQQQTCCGEQGKSKAAVNEELVKQIYPSVVNVALAVRAIAQAVADLCVQRDCMTTQRLQPLELRGALRRATFHMDGKTYTFDSRGDLNTGYDVIMWKQTSPAQLDVQHIIGGYHIHNHSLSLISQKTAQEYQNATVGVVSRCADSCLPGYRKHSAQGQPVCCYECHKCPVDYFSNTTDALECHPCNATTEYSSYGNDVCLRKKIVFLQWNDMYHKLLLAFSALGVLLTIVVGIIFLARWNTPVVRASVGSISLLLLFSLLSTFSSVALFGGEPKLWQCKARQVLFGLSFTLCVSCIMVKSFKIIMAFEFDPRIQSTLQKLYKPHIIIAVCLFGQVIICATWLAIKSPAPGWEKTLNRTERLYMCYENSFPAFGAMLCYIDILALICFVIAFKGRKLPQSYNDAKFITFSMLIHLICWTIFGPVYVNVTGKYLPAVEMVVILITAYSILFCQFITKCYIILFKQEANTQIAFRRDVRDFTLGGVADENDGDLSLYPMGLEGIQNLVLDVEAPVIDPLNDQSQSLSSDVLPCSPPQILNSLLQQTDPIVKNRRQLRRYFSLPANL